MENNQPSVPTISSNPVSPSNESSIIEKIVFALLGLASLLTAGLIGYYLGKSNTRTDSLTDTPPPTGVACTQEAKLCPNGSSVDRTGPNCEFAPCPDSPPTLAMVTITIQGGLCPNGSCKETIIIDQDGTARKNGEIYKQLTPTELTQLMNSIRSTDFEKTKSTPFTETCPTAYDGLETIYSFSLDSINEQVSTCQYKIDFILPLFQQLNRLLEDPKLPLFQ